MQFVIGLFIGAIAASGIWLYLINRPRGGYEPGHGFPIEPDDATALTLPSHRADSRNARMETRGITWTYFEEPSGPPVGNENDPDTIVVFPAIVENGDVIYGPPETNLPDIPASGRVTRDALGLSIEPFPLSNNLGYSSTLISEPIFRGIAWGNGR